MNFSYCSSVSSHMLCWKPRPRDTDFQWKSFLFFFIFCLLYLSWWLGDSSVCWGENTSFKECFLWDVIPSLLYFLGGWPVLCKLFVCSFMIHLICSNRQLLKGSHWSDSELVLLPGQFSAGSDSLFDLLHGFVIDRYDARKRLFRLMPRCLYFLEWEKNILIVLCKCIVWRGNFCIKSD